MTGFIVLAVVLAVLFLEFYSLKRAPERLRADFSCDLSLAEPDEVLAFTFTLRNTSRLPQLFISASVYFEDGISVRESEEYLAKYVERTAAGLSFSRRYFLLPHRSVTETIHFSIDRRGIFTVGKCYLETGDFLGLKSVVRDYPLEDQIVCTARLVPDLSPFEPLGGSDGDFSVQRFIFEDPTLIYGYRDYTGREPMKQISWKATARTRRLIVREEDHTLDRNAVVLADLRTDQPNTLEHTLELIRTVCETLEEKRIPYALFTNSDLGEVPEGLGRQHIHLIQRRIGLSRPVAYFRFEELLGRILQSSMRDRNYILITPGKSEETELLLSLLDRSAAAETTVFYGKEEAS